MLKKLEKILNWMTEFKEQNKVKGVVLGLSGGKDSTVVAMLAKKVFGDNVLAVLMPNGFQTDIQDSINIATTLKLRYRIVNITNAFDGLVNEVNGAGHYDVAVQGYDELVVSEKAKTNIAPRLRMTILYAIAQTLGYLVIGTGNASEAFIGWTTKWGDSASDFNPIKYSTCSDVIEMGKELAKEFGLDEKYIVKKPADGLTNKTDEDNFGFTYNELDYYMTHGFPNENLMLLPDQLEQKCRIEKIKQMHIWSEHKRQPVPGPFEITYDNEEDK